MKNFRKTALVNDVNIFYRDTETEGPAILCLHGRFGRGETWIKFMRRYADSFRIIAPDQRGHGLSDKPIGKYTADEMAEDMAKLIAHCELEKVIVVGHSTGGRIAAYLAAMIPAQIVALVILDQPASGPTQASNLPLSEIPPTDSFTRDWPLPFSNFEDAKAFILDKGGSEIKLKYYMDSLFETESGYEMMFSRQATSAIFEYQQDWHHLLPSFRCPVLLIRAQGGDHVTDEEWRRMQETISDVDAYEVSKPDHHVYLSAPEEFYSYFDRFLSRL